jgi:hypothetical protein
MEAGWAVYKSFNKCNGLQTGIVCNEVWKKVQLKFSHSNFGITAKKHKMNPGVKLEVPLRNEEKGDNFKCTIGKS